MIGIRARTQRQCPHFSLDIQPKSVIPVCSVAGGLKAQSETPSTSTLSPLTKTAQFEVKSPHQYFRFQATEIVPNLYLGGHSDALLLDELLNRNIHHILNVAEECEPSDEVSKAAARAAPQMRLMHVHLRDHSDENIASHFSACNEFILGALRKGEGVLVHCRMGVSRSAAIVIAFLMKYGGIYFPQKLEACCKVMSSRKSCNSGSSCGLSPSHLQQQRSSEQQDDVENDVECVMDRLASLSSDFSRNNSSNSQCSAIVGIEGIGMEELRRADIGIEFPLTYNDSFDIVKARRPEVSPNLGFCLALRCVDVERGILSDIWDRSASQ